MRIPAFVLGMSFLAAAPSARAADKVIYFGGAQAVKSVLDRCFPNFENHGWSDGAGAVSRVIAEINANPNQRYIVAGHSSGAKFANEVASGHLVNPQRITLMDLDGFAPRSVPKNIKRICWTAKGGTSGHILARNYGSMNTGNGCGEVKVHQDNHCSTVWCMHFSIVNANTPASLNDGTWIGHGYDGCKSNPPWLQQ